MMLKPWQVRALLRVGQIAGWIGSRCGEVNYRVSVFALDHCSHPDAEICADQTNRLLVRCRICGDFADGIVQPLETVPEAARRFLREKQQRQIEKRRMAR